MSWLIENWFVVLGVVAILVTVGVAIYKFAGLPTKSQLAKIKEWLLYAVTKAELELGSGTGIIKLRYVYDLFVVRFPLVAKVVSFDTFSGWVDIALDGMKELLETNEKVKTLVESK